MAQRKHVEHHINRRHHIELCNELHRTYAGRAGIVGICMQRKKMSLVVFLEGKATVEQRKLVEEIRSKSGDIPMQVCLAAPPSRKWRRK